MTPTLIVAAVVMFIGTFFVWSDDTDTTSEGVSFGAGVVATSFVLAIVEALTT